MSGKKKCRILREIRRKIAEENDISFVTEECRYKGDCRGTCPKCESELRYLEQQLEKRRAVGRTVTVSALALGVAASFGGCRQTVAGYLADNEPTAAEAIVLEGEVAYPEDGSETDAEETTGDETCTAADNVNEDGNGRPAPDADRAGGS